MTPTPEENTVSGRSGTGAGIQRKKFMNERLTTWLYYAAAALPALLVLVLWVVPKVALQRFRHPTEQRELAPGEKKFHASAA
jgi:hypothetical protein